MQHNTKQVSSAIEQRRIERDVAAATDDDADVATFLLKSFKDITDKQCHTSGSFFDRVLGRTDGRVQSGGDDSDPDVSLPMMR